MDIYLAELRTVSFGKLAEYLPFTTAARQSRIAKMRTEEAKSLSLAAELLVLWGIMNRTGLKRHEIAFEKGAHGKPYLVGNALQFSLSHTAGAVCAAFSEHGEIGIDIERRDRRISDRARERILSEEERSGFHGGEDIIRAWVQKEAFLKRLGVGITRDLRGINTFSLPDTTVIECGDYFVGASGGGAIHASVMRTELSEVLSFIFSRG